APQKQPRPNIAVSRPSGYGPFSGRPLTKCLAAVGIGLARPGSASAAAGISAFFLNMNIAISLLRDANIIAVWRLRTGTCHHIRKAVLHCAITKARGPRIPFPKPFRPCLRRPMLRVRKIRHLEVPNDQLWEEFLCVR